MGPLAWIATALIGAIVGGALVGLGVGIGRELGRSEAEQIFNSQDEYGEDQIQ